MNQGQIETLMLAALERRSTTRRHLHHRECIHNLPPEEQVQLRGRSVEWWQKMIGPLPEQITSEQWETEPLRVGD